MPANLFHNGCFWPYAANLDAAKLASISRDGDVAVNHAIDRISITDGVRWIIDDKTVRVPVEELPARAEGFRLQPECYAGLFASDPLPLSWRCGFRCWGGWSNWQMDTQQSRIPVTLIGVSSMTPLDPRVSVFASVEEEIAYNTWLVAELDKRAEDGRPGIPHDQIGANLAKLLDELKKKVA